MTEMHRNQIAVRLTIDQLTMWGGPEWQRKEASRKRTPPSEEEWAAYLVAEAHLVAARQYEGFDEGCSCDHASVREPTDHIEIEWAETEEEWTERAFALADERGGWPTADDYHSRVMGAMASALGVAMDGNDADWGEPVISTLANRPAQGAYQFKKED